MIMKTKITTVSFWILAGLILVYLAVSIIPSLFTTESIRVEAARAIIYDDSIFVRGIALRDEVSVTASGVPASVDYKVNDGDRVSRGDSVAVYNDVSVSSADRLAVELIDRRISLLNDSLASTSQYDLKTLDARTKDAISAYLGFSGEQNLSSLRQASEQVLTSMIKQDIKARGDKDYYKQILQNCEDEKLAILSGNSAKQTVVRAPYAGYFSSRFDGYESLQSETWTKGEKTITPETVHTFLSYVPENRPDEYIGKLQHFSDWKYVCCIPEEAAERFKIGSMWTIRFEIPSHGTRNVTMTVDSLSVPTEGEVAVVFACTFFDEAIYSLRICDAQIVMKTYSGFRVRKDSIRISDNVSGVHVLSGAKLVFKPVTVLYTGEDSDFAVVAPAVQNSSSTLILNDLVVVGGKDIYDGKVVNIN